MKMNSADVAGTLGRLKERLRGGNKKPRYERRLSNRAALQIPVQVKVGDAPPAASKLHDISPNGLCFEKLFSGNPGDRVWVRFEGYPGVCENFVLAATMVRLTNDKPVRMAAKINRQETRPEALEQYRKLVLHYLRHRPLLEDKEKAFVEGRCKACGWVGRVSVRNRICSRCGSPVSVLIR